MFTRMCYCPRKLVIEIKTMSILPHSLTEYSMIYSVQHIKSKMLSRKTAVLEEK